MGLRNQVIDKIYVIFIYDFLVTLRDNKCKKGVLVPQKFIGRFFLWFFSIKIWGMWQKVFLSLSIIMIRYVVSHDFSGLGQETKFLYIPMTLHTYLMTWSWMKNLLMRVWPSNTKETKKQRNFTLQIMTHCIHSLCEFQPHWKFYFHFRDMTWVRLKLSREVVNLIYLFK